MLLTIHNLPPACRYSDIKNLLNEKCGLTEIILDNLVAEGKGKKVTVGLANDDDGALVVRKINGLNLHGNQLYIEDRRRKTGERDQPYRASNIIPEAGSIEPPISSNPMGGMPMAANVPMMWNMATPYVVQVPVDQIMVPDIAGDVLAVPVKCTEDNGKFSLDNIKSEVNNLVSSTHATVDLLTLGNSIGDIKQDPDMADSSEITKDDCQLKRPMEQFKIDTQKYYNKRQKRREKEQKWRIKEEICSIDQTKSSPLTSVENTCNTLVIKRVSVR